MHDAVTHGINIDETAVALKTGAVPVQKLRWNWSEERIEQALALLRAADAGTGSRVMEQQR